MTGPRYLDPAALDSPDALEKLNASGGELVATMGIRFDSLSREELVATMPVAGNRQPFGLLHGGASGVLAETLGSIHAAILAPDGHFPVGIELSCTHHRSATDGTVSGVSRPLSVGRTLATFEIVLSDDHGNRICTARLTCLYRPAR